ncbi:hypothetical protein GBF38_020240 [Nibea albiflora]|uniref:Uncharacterized protein n=1 Tax=Nibea albiflora TaxID=240163 RepID=A0ACB7FHC2_NIBAL|nr:hypothetical protein GBF38_020240 [Nibea albiflora]
MSSNLDIMANGYRHRWRRSDDPVSLLDIQCLVGVGGSSSVAVSFLWPVPFASWLWTEMGLSACLSFEVLWLSAKHSAVPAAICEEAASSHPSLHFPSMTERGQSQ